MKKITALILALALALTLTACGKSPAQRLIGAWIQKKGDDYVKITFREDGTWHMTISVQKITTDGGGTYSIDENNRLTWNYSEDGQDIVYHLEYSSNAALEGGLQWYVKVGYLFLGGLGAFEYLY